MDALLAAAAGDDPGLLADLRAAFLESLARHIDLLGRARCDANWQMTAWRLKGLGASFQAEALVALAEEALACPPGERVVLGKLRAFLADLSGE